MLPTVKESICVKNSGKGTSQNSDSDFTDCNHKKNECNG